MGLLEESLTFAQALFSVCMLTVSYAYVPDWHGVASVIGFSHLAMLTIGDNSKLSLGTLNLMNSFICFFYLIIDFTTSFDFFRHIPKLDNIPYSSAQGMWKKSFLIIGFIIAFAQFMNLPSAAELKEAKMRKQELIANRRKIHTSFRPAPFTQQQFTPYQEGTSYFYVTKSQL